METTTRNSTQDVIDSLKRLSAGVPPNITFISLGIFAITSNLWTIFCIAKSKSLHTKCFALLAANACVDFLFGVSYGAIATTRLYRYYTGIAEVITMWRCCWEASLITFAQMISLSMSAALVIDRLTATLIPHQYKNMSYKRFTIPLILLAITYAAAQSCVHFVDSWKHKHRTLLTCGIEDTITQENLSVLLAIQISTSIVVVLGNCFLAYLVRKQRTKIDNVHTQNITRLNQLEKEKNELKIFKTITVIVVMHVLTHTGGRVILAIVTAITPDVQIQSLTSRYTRLLVVINAAIHFLILYSTSTQFRSAVRNIVGNKSSTPVNALTINTGNS